jgi:outer membrane protein assembly factor BamB
MELLMWGASVPACVAGDWPCYRGPARTGVVPAESLRTDWTGDRVPIAWRAQAGTGFSSVVVADGRAFTAGHSGDQDEISCFDAATGRLLWRQGYPAELDPNLFEGGPTATPTVDGGDLFTLGRQGLLICWDAATGREKWRVNVGEVCKLNVPGWGFAGSPVIHGDRLLLNAGSAGVALDRRSGDVLWQSDNSDDAGYATPLPVSLSGRPAVLFLSGKALHAVDPESGTQFWEHRWITRYGVNAADPLVQDDLVWLSSGYAKGAALLRVTSSDATEVWRNRELRNQMSPGVLVAGKVYGVDGDENEDQRLKCLDFQSGEVHWAAEGVGAATLIACGDRLLILSGTGELIVASASPDGFQPLARRQVLTGKCWSPPALAHGRLYCRSAAGEVVCVDLRTAAEQ